jgi:retinol dehydrogenase-12
MGTDCLGPYLLTLLLEPILLRTAVISPSSDLRIVWVTSVMHFGTPAGDVLRCQGDAADS